MQMVQSGFGNIYHHYCNVSVVRLLQHMDYSTSTTQQNIYTLLQKQLLLNCQNNRLGLSKLVLDSNADNQLIYLSKCRL